MEAGLGLDQAMARVGQELAFAYPDLSAELRLVNLELLAGKGRSEALRNLADRTGVDDLSSLVAMLVQTDKFGTSVANSLRVFSETLRTKRRQRAEEAAAKTGVKMVFPLVVCIFPAIWIVTIGPAAIGSSRCSDRWASRPIMTMTMLARERKSHTAQVIAPPKPRTLEATGLAPDTISSIIVKMLHGGEATRHGPGGSPVPAVRRSRAAARKPSRRAAR